MKGFIAPTMIDLHTKMANWFIDANGDKVDITNIDVSRTDVIAEASSMEWDYDLKDLWLTESRWDTMVRQYIDPEAFQAWLAKSATLGTSHRGVSVLKANDVASRTGRGGSGTVRKWGGCMLTYSYRALPEPQITMHSRTSYLGYLSVLDMSIAWQIGRILAKKLKIEVEDMKFVWFVENLQWHYFKSLAWILNHPDEEQRAFYRDYLSQFEDVPASLKNDRPVWWGSRRWVKTFLKDDAKGLHYGDMTYNTFRRVRRRYHTEVLGYEYAQQFSGIQYYDDGRTKNYPAFKPLPSIMISDLDFSAIGV